MKNSIWHLGLNRQKTQAHFSPYLKQGCFERKAADEMVYLTPQLLQT